MTDNIGNEVVTDTTESQAAVVKTYTQEEVDAMMARTRTSVESKVKKQYEGLGDPEYLRNLVTEAEQRKTQEQINRGEFEKTLQELAAKKDLEIQKRDEIIKDYRVNTPLVSAAAKYRSVNPEQVRSLLTSNVRMNDEGEVEVIDSKGSVRYNDNGNAFQVDDLVREFLDLNPHFVSASAATTNSRSNHQGGDAGQFDLAKLDLSRAEDRKKYAEAKKAGIV